MKRYFALILMFVGCLNLSAQGEQFPVMSGCEGKNGTDLEACFYNGVQDYVYNNFKVPSDLPSGYTGNVFVLFEVNAEGNFKVLYVDANQPQLAEESRRVFGQMPKATPAKYNGNPTYAKYTINIAIPLLKPGEVPVKAVANTTKTDARKQQARIDRNKELGEFDSVAKMYTKTFDNPQFRSHLNIPFSHSYYSQFDAELNQVGSNNHTASKPYAYADVDRYYNLQSAYDKIKKNKSGWYGRKLWNENTVQIQGEDYWFTLNPIFDLQLGKSSDDKVDYTYINTRGLRLEGGLGSTINFSTTIFESQGRFADYFNQYAESLKPDGGNPAIIPGMGIAKSFKTDSYDFPLAEANLAFTPSKFLNLNLGYGRNFIGDGYRSLLLGDGASPYPYFKINTTFWKIKYTNIYTWLKDVRPGVTEDGTYATKFAASHYLSINLTKRWNLGFFESVIWSKQNDRGFDMSFVNPIIFYRSVEFASSSRSGNAMLAATTKYKITNQFTFYAQYLLDEFSLEDMKSGNQSWKNKFGYQLGLKYFNAFNIDHLILQAEYNHVRPYVYAHSDALTNYGHNNQSLGHQWGGNFQEFVAIGRYSKGRLYADAKFTVGVRGLDFDPAENTANYGSNIYLSYDDNRPLDEGVVIGQGNKTHVFIADVQAGYLVNPSTNLRLFANFIYRNFDPMANTPTFSKDTTSWFTIGLRSDVFNWYFDY
ncbi:gliding motility protein RemB [Flavobacterium sp. MAH-1]|uniref:Gliding motility protein RemB n=1 Tax=Flavobacterium agri TaxID=2743471 RepID=A0A7Y9C7P0_9FLAO|nr:energy transducer TonB [Flavobacterium agri]NUY81604.1 gliding motility protein RemB [Flavobacterium agri]NYA71628.1 gliding motility protein RemB [Flavobacterium agri]